MKPKKLVLIDDTMRQVPKEEKEPTTLWGKPYRDWETDRKSTRLNSSHRL